MQKLLITITVLISAPGHFIMANIYNYSFLNLTCNPFASSSAGHGSLSGGGALILFLKDLSW